MDGRGFRFQVAALDDHRPQMQVSGQETAGARQGLFGGVDLLSAELRQLVGIGGENRDLADKLIFQFIKVRVLKQGMAGGGGQNRVVDHLSMEVCQELAQGPGDLDGTNHAHLDMGHIVISQYRLHLPDHQAAIQRDGFGDATGILDGDAGDCRRAIDTKGGQGLKIRLDARTTRGVGAGNG